MFWFLHFQPVVLNFIFQPNASGEWGEPWGPAAAAGEPQEGPAGVAWQGDNIFIAKAILVHKYISQTQQLESPDKVSVDLEDNKFASFEVTLKIENKPTKK